MYIYGTLGKTNIDMENPWFPYKKDLQILGIPYASLQVNNGGDICFGHMHPWWTEKSMNFSHHETNTVQIQKTC